MRLSALLLLTLLTLLGAALTAAAPPSLRQTIQASRWQKRVLLVMAPTAGQPDFKRQKELLAAAPAELRARDVLVLDVLYDHLAPADRQYLQQELKLHLTGFEAVLVGKDGGVKQTSTHPLAPAAWFGTIDKMPMRRQEMRRGY